MAYRGPRQAVPACRGPRQAELVHGKTGGHVHGKTGGHLSTASRAVHGNTGWTKKFVHGKTGGHVHGKTGGHVRRAPYMARPALYGATHRRVSPRYLRAPISKYGVPHRRAT